MRELVKVVLGGKEYALRPTFEAYGEIEARHGPLRVLYTQAFTGSATLAALAYVLYVGIRQVSATDARGNAWSEDAVARVVWESGPWSQEVINGAAEFLAALGWTPEQRAKIDEEAARLEAATMGTTSR